jgi:UPF0716 protein FxsA
MVAMPGLLSDMLGLLLLLPPVQLALGRVGNAVVASVAKRAMGGMMGGAGGGLFGAFGKMGGSPFPGMQPRGFPGKPDDRVVRKPKIIDTTVEKD